MSDVKLGDETRIFNILDDRPVQAFRDLFEGKNVMALRIHGLFGDCIKASSVLSELIKEDPARKYVILISYNNVKNGVLVRDLFSELISAGIIVGLFLNEYGIVGNISYPQFSFLQDLGCKNIQDLYYFNSNGYKRKTGIAYLGFQNPQPKPDKVALFRFSGFHQHVPKRHIPENEWLDIERHLLNLGLDINLYGYEDSMKTLVSPEKDFRKKLTVLGTIKHASDSGLSISTTTYLPIYLHHFIPCLVFADPTDMYLINTMWRSNHNYQCIDTQRDDHVSYVKSYSSMWYLSNLNTKTVLSSITESLSGLVTNQVTGVNNV